jgi:hypothetical protein
VSTLITSRVVAQNNRRSLCMATRLTLGVAFGLSALCESPPKTPFEFWHGGDHDALSQRLAVAVEEAFERSTEFTSGSGKKPGTLLVYIPDPVRREKRLWLTRAVYTVKFKTPEGQDLGTESGRCWSSDIGKCAFQIVSSAQTAASRMAR